MSTYSNMIDCSTSHVHPSLDWGGERIVGHEHGWTLFVRGGIDVESSVVEWLQPLYRLALAGDCMVINFDTSGKSLDGIPVYAAPVNLAEGTVLFNVTYAGRYVVHTNDTIESVGFAATSFAQPWPGDTPVHEVLASHAAGDYDDDEFEEFRQGAENLLDHLATCAINGDGGKVHHSESDINYGSP